MNEWQFIKSVHPSQINQIFITHPNGDITTHMHIRTKLFNHLTIRSNKTMEDLTKYQDNQSNATIDTLTNLLTTLDTDVSTHEKSLNELQQKRLIVRTVLSQKLLNKIDELELSDAEVDNAINDKDKFIDLKDTESGSKDFEDVLTEINKPSHAL